MITLLPLLLGLLNTPQPIYAALTTAPTALLVQEDELLVAVPDEIVLFRLDRGVMVQRHRLTLGPVRRLSGWDPAFIDTADARWQWSRGAAPEKLPVSPPADPPVKLGKWTWTLDAKGAVLRDGVPLAAMGATDLIRLGPHGVLAFRRGAKATGEGDLVRFDAKGVRVWTSGRAPKPTAAAFDPKRKAIWIGNPSGGIDRWRVEDGTRVPAIPSGRSEPAKCVAHTGTQAIVGDAHGGVWLWKDRELVAGKRFAGLVESVTLTPAPAAVVRTGDGLVRWSPQGEAPARAPGTCTAPPVVAADGSLLLGDVIYYVRADGHWRSESKVGIERGRITPRRGR